MKTLEFIYQGTEIHFLINPLDKNVMINATEMAKPFDKEVRSFLRLDGTQKFINILIEKQNNRTDVYGYNENNTVGYTKEDIVVTNKKSGTLMHRKLALKFAAWLDTEFELWVIDIIDEVIFGNYQKHWEAHAVQEAAKLEMETLKAKLLENPNKETAIQYFEAERTHKEAKAKKTSAIRNQLNLFKKK